MPEKRYHDDRTRLLSPAILSINNRTSWSPTGEGRSSGERHCSGERVRERARRGVGEGDGTEREREREREGRGGETFKKKKCKETEKADLAATKSSAQVAAQQYVAW